MVPIHRPFRSLKNLYTLLCHHDLNQVARMFLATAGALCSRSGLGSGEHVAVCHQQDQARRRAEHVQIVRSSPQYHSRKRSPGFDRALKSDVHVGMQVSNFRGVTFDRALVSDTNKQSITITLYSSLSSPVLDLLLSFRGTVTHQTQHMIFRPALRLVLLLPASQVTVSHGHVRSHRIHRICVRNKVLPMSGAGASYVGFISLSANLQLPD
jgi:hypothetical protein